LRRENLEAGTGEETGIGTTKLCECVGARVKEAVALEESSYKFCDIGAITMKK
jgi:hypothetical protein